MTFHPNEVARRGRIVRVVVSLVLAAIGSAFFRAQVMQRSQFALQSEANRLREVPLAAPRAIILDRDGEIVAENLPGYAVSLLPDSVAALRETLETLATIIPMDSSEREAIVQRYRRDRSRPAVVYGNASIETVALLEEHRAALPGLIIQTSPKRYYPDGPAVAALIGYTGEISPRELEQERFEGYKAGQWVGKSGIERQYEELLHGREGARYVEVDARGRIVREANVRADAPAEVPPPVTSTIDLDLQRYTHELFGDSIAGAVVALDPKTGELLALYNGPSYDANRFTGRIPASLWDSLNSDPRLPLYNKAIQGAFAPASTFKLATAVIGMELGLVDIDTHMPVRCNGGYQIGRRYFRCWDRNGHGDISLAQAIAKSCDTYFYQLGLRIGIERMVAAGLRMGFGERTGIDLPYETKPSFPSPDAKTYFDKRYGARGWTKEATVANMSIGQGENSQTLISMARFYSALATDGTAVQPHLIRGEYPRDTLFQLSPEQLADVRAAMADVVSARGTAGRAQIEGITIAGKTGTAQNETGIDHAWFVGFAPYEDPKIVVAVFRWQGLHGSWVAPIATKVMERYLRVKVNTSDAALAGGG